MFAGKHGWLNDWLTTMLSLAAMGRECDHHRQCSPLSC
jgi:hypothetical protein